MRTLSRPMFKMGGPIKEGVMHGIREPHFKGQIVGKAMPHIQKALQSFKNIFGKTVPKQVQTGTKIKMIPGSTPSRLHKGYPGGSGGATVERGKPIYGTRQVFEPNWFSRQFIEDPLAKTVVGGTSAFGRGVKWVGKKGYGAAKYGLTTPSGLALTAAGTYGFWPDGTPKDSDAVTGVPLNPNLQKKKKLSAAAKKEFALEQRENRVNRYLELMGYDRAKKTAIADALIDASKIVSDRGTLDKKNINRELINPIIQATSKRLDKPDQIREAVGLMATKAEIEKDLEDPQVKKLRALQIEKGEKELTPGVGPSIMAYMAAKKGKVKGDELKDLVRLAANQEGTKFKYITDEEVALIPELKGKTAIEIVSSTAKEDGVYMVGDAVIEVKGGIPTQIK